MSSRSRSRSRRSRSPTPDSLTSIFMSNFEPDIKPRDIETFFEDEGLHVETVSMKTGFAFAIVKDKPRKVRRAVDHLNGSKMFKDSHRRVRVEISRQKQGYNESSRIKAKRAEPNKALFVVNFDQRRTYARDLESLFGKYGKLIRVDMKATYCFVEYTELSDAIEAKESLDGSLLQGCRLTVEYTVNRPGGGGPSARSHSRSQQRSRRSPSIRRRSPSRSRSRGRGRSRSRSRRRSRRSRSRSRRRSRRSRSRSRRRSRRSRSRRRRSRSSRRHRSRSRSRGRSRSRSRSRSKKKSQNHRKSKSNSKSHHRSKSKSNSKSHHRSKSKSKSQSKSLSNDSRSRSKSKEKATG